MAEFTGPSPMRAAIRNRFRRLGLGGMLVIIAIVVAVSGRDAEKLGDNFQIALPLAALGCALAEGQAVRYVGRYLLTEVFIKTPKASLGTASINIRPNGGDRGFPSGHTTVAAFGATALVRTCLKDSPSGQAAAIIAAGFTGASRITSQNHTIWQVLAGAILGFCMQYLTLTAFDRAFARLMDAGRSSLSRLGRFFGLGMAGALAAMAGLAAPDRASADWSVDVYTGHQTAPHSRVTGDDPATGGDRNFNFLAGWEGKPFAMPPYYGVRGIQWRDESFGWFADFNHTKLYADSDTLGSGGTSGGFAVLEFTDGLNNLTFGPVFRWPNAWGKLSPYVAPGIGVALPHVEVQTSPTAPKTFKYQYGGPSVSFVAGASMPLGKRTEVFGEYKGTYSRLDVDLVGGGGHLKTNVITNALNVGLRVHFGR